MLQYVGNKASAEGAEQLDAAEAARIFEAKLKSALLAEVGGALLAEVVGGAMLAEVVVRGTWRAAGRGVGGDAGRGAWGYGRGQLSWPGRQTWGWGGVGASWRSCGAQTGGKGGVQLLSGQRWGIPCIVPAFSPPVPADSCDPFLLFGSRELKVVSADSLV